MVDTPEVNYYPVTVNSSTKEGTAEEPQTNTPNVGQPIGIDESTVSLSNIVTIAGGSLLKSGYFQSSNFVKGSSGFNINSDGNAEFNNIVARGEITATTGAIGGFVIGSDYITDTANSFGLASTVTGGNDVRFWAGDTFANRATADLRIYEDGSIIATNITATGAINATSGWIGSATALVYESQGINTGITGYIRGGQTGYNTGIGYFLGYSSGEYKFSVGNGTNKYLKYDPTDGLQIRGQNSVSSVFTAGRDISAGAPVALGSGTESILEANAQVSNSNIGSNDLSNANNWDAQTFLTSNKAVKISSIKMKVSNISGASSRNAIVSIRATSGGEPTGSDLGVQSVSVSIGPSTTGNLTTFTFATPIDVTPNTTYAIKLDSEGGNGIRGYGDNAGGYGDGSYYQTTNDGTSFSDTGDDAYFEVYEIQAEAGKVYETDASVSSDLSNNFIGFADEAVSADDEVAINISGIDTNQIGLTTADIYYLSDTEGEISTTPGTVSKKVGLSMSATSILILNS